MKPQLRTWQSWMTAGFLVAALLLATRQFCFDTTPAEAQKPNRTEQVIDVQRSILKLEIGTGGFLSAFGHRHEIEGRIAQGRVQCCDSPSVELRIEAKELHVVDPGEPDDVRAKIEARMLGPEVLDTSRFPDIRFQSTSVSAAGKDRWTARGDLTLHGQTHTITADVSLANGQYEGETKLRQSDFGITPVSVAGGSVKVKDEIRVAFDIATVH
ncbi:MAG: YceI family protein [Candidatus Acidiferrales bacterium]